MLNILKEYRCGSRVKSIQYITVSYYSIIFIGAIKHQYNETIQNISIKWSYNFLDILDILSVEF